MEKILYKSNKGKYNFAMAFPAIESFALSSLGYMWLYKALSSLGYMWLYKIADTMEGVNAERISTDNLYISSSKIDSIAFSMSFDFDFLGVFEILERLKIPFYKNDRDTTCPLVFAGGPVITTNPAPYEAFFDFMIIGDGEECFTKVLEILRDNSRQDALEILKGVDGVYFPGEHVKKATVNLNEVIYTPILSDKSYFKNTFVIELARGCMNRCAFCTASYTNQIKVSTILLWHFLQ